MSIKKGVRKHFPLSGRADLEILFLQSEGQLRNDPYGAASLAPAVQAVVLVSPAFLIEIRAYRYAKPSRDRGSGVFSAKAIRSLAGHGWV